MNRAAVIEQLRATQETLNKLLALLESSQGDRFAAHIYQSRRDYRHACDIAGKSGKQIERCVISTCQIAQSLGFKGDFRQWEHLLRIHVDRRLREGTQDRGLTSSVRNKIRSPQWNSADHRTITTLDRTLMLQ